MSRAKRTAKDFPQEYLVAWQLAVEGKLRIQMDSPGQARNMIQQLYIYRKRLMEESPEIAGPFYSVDLKVHDVAGNVLTGKATAVPQKAIIRPAVSTWKEQIRTQLAASERGVEEVPVHVAPVVSPQEEAPDTLTETLSDLGYTASDNH